MTRKLNAALILSLSIASVSAFTLVPYRKWRQFEKEAAGHRLAIAKERLSISENAARVSTAASSMDLSNIQREVLNRDMTLWSRAHERFESMEAVEQSKAELEARWWFRVLVFLPASVAVAWAYLGWTLLMKRD